MPVPQDASFVPATMLGCAYPVRVPVSTSYRIQIWPRWPRGRALHEIRKIYIEFNFFCPVAFGRRPPLVTAAG